MVAVLVVDDEPDICELVRRMLLRAGMSVVVATGIREAVRLLHAIEGPIDLVVTDLTMPGGTGDELAAHVERVRPGTRVLYMSGLAPNHAVVRALGPTASVLGKPFTSAELLAAVTAALPAGAVMR